jgi:hypothetical protein
MVRCVSRQDMTPHLTCRVINAGPIPYADIELCGDPDLEHGLRHLGFEPSETAYRLLEITLESITDRTDWIPRYPGGDRLVLDAMAVGTRLPPIVVLANDRGFGIIDGVNRTYAARALNWRAIEAYDLLT